MVVAGHMPRYTAFMALSRTSAPTLELEGRLLASGHRRIAGVDEVGRGSLAGPVVAAAVVLPLTCEFSLSPLADLRDSKILTARMREELFRSILSVATAIGLGWASHHVIDRDGIASANRRALLRAVRALRPEPDALLLDYFRLPESHIPQLAVSHGDALSMSIAAASVVAKVVRDRWMVKCDGRFAGYGFAHHKGYATSAHRQALREIGPCRLHRKSFLPVAACSR